MSDASIPVIAIPAAARAGAGSSFAAGVAILAADTYGWSVLALRKGGVRIGTSLLRSPMWPDPAADRGEHRIAYALTPTAGATVGALIASLESAYPGLKERICDDSGQVRRFVNIFANDEDIRFLKGLETPIKDSDEVSIVPAIAGGR